VRDVCYLQRDGPRVGEQPVACFEQTLQQKEAQRRLDSPDLRDGARLSATA